MAIFALGISRRPADVLYENLRWQNWRKEIRNLSGDSVYTFFPFLCTEEGGDINQFSRKPIAIAEHYASTLDLQKSIL